MIAKRLALLHELVPGAARVAALINPTDAVRAEAVRNDLQSAVRTMGVQLQIFTASSGFGSDMFVQLPIPNEAPHVFADNFR